MIFQNISHYLQYTVAVQNLVMSMYNQNHINISSWVQCVFFTVIMSSVILKMEMSCVCVRAL